MSAEKVLLELAAAQKLIGALLAKQSTESAATELKLIETTLAEAGESCRAQARELELERRRLNESQAVAKIGSWETEFPVMNNRWTAETHRIFGTDPATFQPSQARFIEFVHPDDRESVHSALLNSQASAGPHTLVFRITAGDKTAKVVESRWVTFKDAAGAPLRFVGTCQDITTSRNAEEERDRLFSFSLDMLCVAGFDGRLHQVNPAWTHTLGWSAEELTSRPMNEFVHPEDRDATSKTRAHIHQGNSVRGFENRYRCKDGSYRRLSWNVHPLPASQKVFAVARDITETRLIEEQLRQSQKMESIGLLAGGIAHDFNNLLTIINGRSQLMIDKMSPNSPLRKDVDIIGKAGDRAAGLTKQLLAFSRKQLLTPRQLNLNKLLREMENLLRGLVREDIEVTTILGQDLHRVHADPNQLEQVILNLVANARDAIAGVGRLTIETANTELTPHYCRRFNEVKPGSYVMLAVTDTGHGMDEATKARIFEPFFTTKGLGKGTGLGLATAFGIIKQSRGHIEVSSEIGQGTTFRIYLPQAGTASVSLANTQAVQVEKGRERILVVEDEEEIRELVRELLESYGYVVTVAANGADALKLAAEQLPIDLVITDLIMPKLGGLGLVDKLKELNPNLRCLFMSGYTDEMPNLSADFLQKPFTPAALAKKVREILDRE